MTWTDDPARAKRLGHNVMLIGYVLGPVPAGLALGAALTTGVSSDAAKLAIVALVIGMIVALSGGVLMNVAARADARAAGRPWGSFGPAEARRVRSLGTAALVFGAVSLTLGVISALLKLSGTGAGGQPWFYFVLLLGMSAPLLVAGLMFRRIAASHMVTKTNRARAGDQ